MDSGVTHYYQMSIQSVMTDMRSSIEGISSSEADDRLRTFGHNRLDEFRRRSILVMFIDQFRDFMIIVLIAAAVISGTIGDVVDTIAIVVIIILNAVIGFIQEYRAEKAMQALKKMASPDALVRRDGRTLTVPDADIVPGDMVLLETGRFVPADMRIIESAQLHIEEAALTGESLPVLKETEALAGEHPLGDRKNMAFKGTTVSYGRGAGLVVHTGMKTELGKIAALLQTEEEVKTPLQKRLAKFGQRLAIVVIIICVVVFIAGLLRGESPLLMFLTAISLAVAAIPEALPAVVTISLALGAKKMVMQNSLIRKLPAVETLGSVTYICSDKTGTLTLNRMKCEEIYIKGALFKGGKCVASLDEEHADFMTAIALNNDSVTTEDGSPMGDPTETALLEAAQKAGFIKADLEKEFPRVDEIPFDSGRKCMTTIHAISTAHRLGSNGKWKYVAFTKGAFETIVERSVRLLTENGEHTIIDEHFQEEIKKINMKMADDGLRTIAVAMRLWEQYPGDLSSESVEKELTMLGIAGLMDPPRVEAAEAVDLCRSAGIKPVMITGDHPLTARNIARRLGIIRNEDTIMTGPELDKLPQDEFQERVGKISVYARMAPEQKIKIVRALQERGEFVAMTGDGVNDAPALKRADIGISMGVTGTDVAKEASHMVLLDDNFATIVTAVKEGRRIFDNIRKFIKYTMTSNSGEIWTIFLAPFLGLPIPLLPVHILWINLVTDGLPGLALAAEPAEHGIMKRPPRHPKENIFAHGMASHMLWIGLLMGAVSICTQAWAYQPGGDQARWQTMVFTVLCLSQMGNVLAIRSESESLFRQGLLSNRPLFWAVLLTFGLQMMTIYVPALNPIFKTIPLTMKELAIVLALSSVVFFVVESGKWFSTKHTRTG